MIFILYSHVDQANIDSSLGLPEYSYYFVLKEFRLALEQIGSVIVVVDPAAEVDAIYADSKARGESCVFICFSPPNKAWVDLACPSLCIFAWEFDRIPDETWDDDPRNDWRYVFGKHGRTISLSEDSAAAVRASMGADFPVAAIPVPVWDRFAGVHQKIHRHPLIAPTTIRVAGNIIDSRLYSISTESISLAEPGRCFAIPEWDGETIEMDLKGGGADAGYLVGFYEPEPWGCWSKVEEPWILLPYRVSGCIRLTLIAAAYGANVGRSVCVKFGDQYRLITLTPGFSHFEMEFRLGQSASSVRILGLDLSPIENAIDGRTMGVALKSLRIEQIESATHQASGELPIGTPDAEVYGNGAISVTFNEATPEGCHLMGFYPGEPWGVWSRSAKPWVLFSQEFCGEITLQFCARAYGANINRDVSVVLGEQSQTITLTGKFKTFVLNFSLEQPIESVRFGGLDITPLKGVTDNRTMGIGLSGMSVTGLKKPVNATPEPQHTGSLSTSVSGVVYTSVFNPGDDRKNWIDMLTAFVFAFRDVEDATLLLKMTHHSVSSYLGHFHYYLQRLAPFKCRVVIVHGFLEERDFETLIAASSYYVNTSRCEGLCLPLMEFMACGKPAIAPLHTAMRDYVDEASTFVIKSSVEPGIWPHDPRDVFRAFRYRLSWSSLVECYQESYRIAKHDVPQYEAMSANGINRIKQFCSREIVKNKLADFLHLDVEG